MSQDIREIAFVITQSKPGELDTKLLLPVSVENMLPHAPNVDGRHAAPPNQFHGRFW